MWGRKARPATRIRKREGDYWGQRKRGRVTAWLTKQATPRSEARVVKFSLGKRAAGPYSESGSPNAPSRCA